MCNVVFGVECQKCQCVSVSDGIKIRAVVLTRDEMIRQIGIAKQDFVIVVLILSCDCC